LKITLLILEKQLGNFWIFLKIVSSTNFPLFGGARGGGRGGLSFPILDIKGRKSRLELHKSQGAKVKYVLNIIENCITKS